MYTEIHKTKKQAKGKVSETIHITIEEYMYFTYL